MVGADGQLASLLSSGRVRAYLSSRGAMRAPDAPDSRSRSPSGTAGKIQTAIEKRYGHDGLQFRAGIILGACTMSIDTTGKWWLGSEPADIREYLVAYTQDGYPVSDFRLAKCSCGSDIFNMATDDDEGVAKRTCVTCASEHFICDSEEFQEDAKLEEFSCIECGSKQANIGVGFSLYDDGEIRWLYVGARCVACGILGCFADWKVAYSPSRDLIERV